MDSSSSQNHPLLESEENSCKDDLPVKRPYSGWLLRHKLVATLLLLFLPSPALDIIPLLQGRYTENRPDLGHSSFSQYSFVSSPIISQELMSAIGGLEYNTPIMYRAQTDFWSINETLSNELWNALDTSPIGVALTDDYAKQHDLPLASRFPWDDEKGTYFIKAFHQIHCLVGTDLYQPRPKRADHVIRS